jgi:hypothetical protein
MRKNDVAAYFKMTDNHSHKTSNDYAEITTQACEQNPNLEPQRTLWPQRFTEKINN